MRGRFVGLDLKGPNLTEAIRSKVAIVDDDNAVRDSLQFLLEIMGYLLKHSHRQPSS